MIAYFLKKIDKTIEYFCRVNILNKKITDNSLFTTTPCDMQKFILKNKK